MKKISKKQLIKLIFKVFKIKKINFIKDKNLNFYDFF
jgi:hypothetical protein